MTIPTETDIVPKSNERRDSIPNNFGDIMSSRETKCILPSGYTGLERMLLTANGNLQRLLSAYFNTAVVIDIVRNDVGVVSEEAPDMVCFDREVNLKCHNQTVCNAVSNVQVSKNTYLDLIVDKSVGIGQLFRYLNILPEFELICIGRKPDGSLWRTYSLSTHGIRCEITEVFPSDLLTMFE